MTVGDQLVHADRGDGHAVLVVLDFLRDSDLHATDPSPSSPDESPGTSQEDRVDDGRVRDPAGQHPVDQVGQRQPEQLHVRLLVRGHEVAAVRGAEVLRQVEVDELAGHAR